MKFWKRRLIATLILLGLFVLASFIKVVTLDEGGAVTCLSLLFLWLVTFFFGFKYGLVCSVLFGLARLGVDFLSPETVNDKLFSILLEYPLGYGVFCLGGLLKEPKREGYSGFGKVSKEALFKLRMGYVIGLFGQWVLFVVSAARFYDPGREGTINNLLFCMIYDGSYLLVEGGVTFLALCVPQMGEALLYLKDIIIPGEEDDTLECF